MKIVVKMFQLVYFTKVEKIYVDNKGKVTSEFKGLFILFA